MGMQTGAATWAVPKLKIESPYDAVFPLLDIYPKNMKTLIQKDKCTPMFRVALFTIVKIWKQPKCPPIDEWMQKTWCTYTWNIIQP